MSNIGLVLTTVKTDSIPSTAFHSLTQEISLGELHEAVPRLRAHLEVQIKKNERELCEMFPLPILVPMGVPECCLF